LGVVLNPYRKRMVDMFDYKVLAKVKFNDEIALVLDRKPVLEYTKHKGIIYGTDGIFYQCYKYDRPGKNWEAFGGHKFDIKLTSGEVINCNGQWWHGGHAEVEKLAGVTLCSAVHSTVDALKKCYVFSGDAADSKKFNDILNSYNGDILPYFEYEKLLNKEHGGAKNAEKTNLD